MEPRESLDSGIRLLSVSHLNGLVRYIGCHFRNDSEKG